ncbi:MAG: Rne/Rng family ribonuclease [Actinobacteria bacterium]|nr:Rne/Rng family ribonuclease [Actinomycetota bacterium]
MEAKRQRRREGREAGRRRTIISEAEFLARRESVERVMVVRGLEDRTQIGVLEDGVLVEHYVSRRTQTTMAGNVYLGRVQNVLPSMEAAFVDVGKGRNAVLYAGEVNWDVAGMQGDKAKRIENALSSGESVLAQVSKDPIGHKGARLTSQVSLPGRYLVYVPDSSMTGISRKLPDTERSRLKKILKEVVPADAGVIVRTAAEGASEAELKADVERLSALWERIQTKAKSASAPALLHGEPDMTVRVIRDVFNEDFTKLIVSGDAAWKEVSAYIDSVAPDLADRVEKWTGELDVFAHHRVSEGLAKAMDRKVWLPSGGSLVIDRTEAMTVVDVNTGKFVGSGGNLEQTVTKNNIEAAEEIVRQLRLRDIGGIIVIDFIDMVLESNRELVVRRLLECLGRDRTKHQVAEVTSLGLVQMTRKRVGAGLVEVFSESCEHCSGRGIMVHPEPIDKPVADNGGQSERARGRKSRNSSSPGGSSQGERHVLPTPNPTGPTPAQIAAAAHAAALQSGSTGEVAAATAKAVVEEVQSKGTAAEPGQEAPASRAAATVDEDAAGQEISDGDRSAAGTPAPQDDAAQEERVPAARPRRKRGRVVAAAGPPGSAPVEAPTTGAASLAATGSER